MSKLKDLQKQFIIKESTKLFMEKGIDNVTMYNIANEVGIGEATLYRYFGKKEHIVILAGCHNWKNLVSKYLTDEFLDKAKSLTGYQMIEYYFNTFARIFQEDKQFLFFIHDFDAYVTSHKISVNDLETYNNQLLEVKSTFDTAYEKGLRDLSIRKDVNPNTFYFTATHALLGLCAKMASDAIVGSDTAVGSNNQIQLLVSMVTSYIRN